MNKNSDEYLIAQIVLYDNHRAFKKLLDRYQNGLQNLLLKLVNFDQALAEDLSQETFIKIYKNLKFFNGKSKLSTWLYRITYNVFLDHRKKRIKDQQLKVNLQDSNTAINSSIEKDIHNKMDVETFITYLKPEEKAAIQLSYISGFTHEEISEIMQCPLGTVKSHINRGKERIKKHLKNNENRY